MATRRDAKRRAAAEPVRPPTWLVEIYPASAAPLGELWGIAIASDDGALWPAYLEARDEIRANEVQAKQAKTVRSQLGRASHGSYVPHVLLAVAIALRVDRARAEAPLRRALEAGTDTPHAARLRAELTVLAARHVWTPAEVRRHVLEGAHASIDDARHPPSVAHALGAALAAHAAIGTDELVARARTLATQPSGDPAALWVVVAALVARGVAPTTLAELQAATLASRDAAWSPLVRATFAAMRRWRP